MNLVDWVNRENNLYGHLDCLADYSSQSIKFLPGRLQHGWNPTDGFGFWEGAKFPGRLFVWSERVKRDLINQGHKKTQAIGAPWVYLFETRRDVIEALHPTLGILAIPGHSSARAELIGNHSKYAQELRRSEGPNADITVSLFWRDYEKPDVRHAYEDQGIPVVTLGDPNSYTKTEFLFEQMRLLKKYERCVSNRLLSGLIYATALGVETEIYGSEMSISGEQDPDKFSRVRWPDLYQGNSSIALKKFAQDELGFDLVLPKEQIAALLRPSLGRFINFASSRVIDSSRRNFIK